jgi:hypothetical protein
MSAEIERLAAFHGPRLQARLERAITEQLARRRLARLLELQAQDGREPSPAAQAWDRAVIYGPSAEHSA